MSVMYRPSSSGGSSNWGSNRGGQYRSPQDTTRSIRNFSGFASTVTIAAFLYLGSQFIAIVFASAGSIGYIVLVGISTASLITATIIVFKVLNERKAAFVLLPIGLFFFSFLLPGLPAL